MNNDEFWAELKSMRLDMEHLSGINHAQSLAIRALLQAIPDAHARIERYQSLASRTDHGGGFSEEQLKAIDMTLKSVLSPKN